MDEISLRSLFHGALDEVAPPKPWLVQAVRDELGRHRQSERSRRRFRLWSPALQRALAAILVMVIAGTAAAATIAVYERTHHQVPVINSPTGPAIRSCGTTGSGGVRMFDKNIGWRGTERTTDGGLTWHDVSPPAPAGSIKGGGATCTFDPDVAWQLYGTGTVPYEPTHLVLMSTNDAGRSWQQDSTIPVPWAVSWRITFSALLDFLDLKHGWLFMEYATQPLQRRIYATSDGGLTWSQVSAKTDLGLGNMAFDCSQTGLMFHTLERGWLTWGCSSGFGDTPPSGSQVVAVTNDGGMTWAALELPNQPIGAAATCDATSPVFTMSDGMLQLSCGLSSALYSTPDGGASWSAHLLSSPVPIDIVDGTTGFYFSQPDHSGPNTLYRTRDGGAHWSVVAAGLFPGESTSDLTFIDQKVGFVNVGDSPGPWWTFDGGKTWALQPPYRSAGSNACGTYLDPGAGYQLPQSVKMVSPTVGWAPGARRTVDGGTHWAKVPQPAPKYQDSGYGEFFLDPNNAWVVETAGSAKVCADRFVTYRTTDGGVTWQQASAMIVQGLQPDVILRGLWTVQVEFVDDLHGWLQVSTAVGLGRRHPGPLYSTPDGGKTWSLVTLQPHWSSSDCSGDGLPLFSSPTTGWIADTCTGATRSSYTVLVTRDGGVTWTSVELLKGACSAPAYPDGCPFGGPLPTFVDADHGWWTDGSTLLVTSDGGRTWTPRTPSGGRTYSCQGKYGPTTCSSLGINSVSFVAANEGWVVASIFFGGYSLTLLVEHTTDGGKTWAIVNKQNTNIQADQGEFFQFVDSSHGFWWFGNVVTQTSDGGRTWTSTKVSYQ